MNTNAVQKESEMLDASCSASYGATAEKDPCEDSVCISPLQIAMIDTLGKADEKESPIPATGRLFFSF